MVRMKHMIRMNRFNWVNRVLLLKAKAASGKLTAF
jgi:hypothetical protein